MSDLKEEQQGGAGPVRQNISAGEPVRQNISVEVPELLGLVDFQYCNFVRLASNNTDVRIAFGDIGPTGKLTPRDGFALSPIVAKSLHKALGGQLSKIESEHGPIPESPVEIQILVVKNKAETGESDS